MLADGAKLAGILAEQAGDAIVVGIGINVGATRDELPPPGPGALPATSLALLGQSARPSGARGTADRDPGRAGGLVPALDSAQPR